MTNFTHCFRQTAMHMPGELRDILLAIIYEWQYCQEKGEEFPKVTKEVTLSPDETLNRIKQIGEQLCQKLPTFLGGLGNYKPLAQAREFVAFTFRRFSEEH
jgi:hypothetical protein